MRVVAEAERLVAEVNEVLAAQERLFARHNITKEQLVAMLKKIGGTKLESELKERMAQFQKIYKARLCPPREPINLLKVGRLVRRVTVGRAVLFDQVKSVKLRNQWISV